MVHIGNSISIQYSLYQHQSNTSLKQNNDDYGVSRCWNNIHVGKIISIWYRRKE